MDGNWLVETIKNGGVGLLVISMLSWVYIQMQKIYCEFDKEATNEINIAITTYADLIYKIEKFIENENRTDEDFNNLERVLINKMSIVSFEVFELIKNWQSSKGINELEKISGLLYEELTNIKRKQKNNVKLSIAKGVIEQFAAECNRVRLRTFIYPVLIIVVVLVLLVGVTIFVNSMNNSPTKIIKVYYFLSFIYAGIITIFGIMLFDMVGEKRYINNTKNWSWFASLFVLPIIISVCTLEIDNYAYRLIVLIICIGINFFYLKKKLPALIGRED